MRMMAQDPETMSRVREQYVEDRMRLTPEQRAVYEGGIRDLEKFYADRAAQEREDRITSALIGAAGKSTVGLTGAGYAAGDLGARRAAMADRLRGIESLGKARTGLIDIERANVQGALGAGAKEREQAGLETRQGLESGSRLYGYDVNAQTERERMAQEAELRREALSQAGRLGERKLDIEELNVEMTKGLKEAQMQAIRLDREEGRDQKLAELRRRTLADFDRFEAKLEAAFREKNMILLNKEQTGKLAKEEKTTLEDARAAMEKALTARRRQMNAIFTDPNTANWKVSQE
jgi:hypothetical protein